MDDGFLMAEAIRLKVYPVIKTVDWDAIHKIFDNLGQNIAQMGAALSTAVISSFPVMTQEMTLIIELDTLIAKTRLVMQLTADDTYMLKQWCLRMGQRSPASTLQVAIENARALYYGAASGHDENWNNIRKIIAGQRYLYYNPTAPDAEHKTFAVGDGQTRIVEPPFRYGYGESIYDTWMRDHRNDAAAYSTFAIIDDPFTPTAETPDAQAELLKWYTQFYKTPPPVKDNLLLDNLTDIVQAAKQAEHQRSRDDLRKKTRELRKRKGKR